MKNSLNLILLLSVALSSQARMVGPYFNADWQYTNTRSITRDIESDLGEGKIIVSGSKLEVKGNATAANNAVVDVDPKGRGHGLRLGFGYQMNSWWAWDFSYNLFADAEWDRSSTKFSGTIINNQYSLDVAGIGTYPIVSNISLSGRVGVAFLRSSITFDNTVQAANNVLINRYMSELKIYSVNSFLGLGLVYDLNRYASINADVIQYRGAGKIDDATNMQVGMSYYFGR